MARCRAWHSWEARNERRECDGRTGGSSGRSGRGSRRWGVGLDAEAALMLAISDTACRSGMLRSIMGGAEFDIEVSRARPSWRQPRSEEHTSELQSLMRISYAVFCLKKKNIFLSHLLYYYI